MKGKGSELVFSVILGNRLGRGLRKAACAHGISSGPGFEASRSTTARERKETKHLTLFKAHKAHPNPPQQELQSCLWDCFTQNELLSNVNIATFKQKVMPCCQINVLHK